MRSLPVLLALLTLLLMGLLGAASVATGVAWYADTVVKCGQRVMTPEDTCKSRNQAPHDFAEQRASEDLQSAIAIGIGVLFLLPPVLGVVGLGRHLWHRRRPGAQFQRELPANLRELTRRGRENRPFSR